MKKIMRKPLTRTSILVSFLFITVGAKAVPIEIGAMGGWRFGGTFDDSMGRSYSADASGSWGGIMDIYTSPGTAVELLFSRQESSVQIEEGALPFQFNYTLDHYQIGGLKEYGETAFRPFLAGLVGWSHAKAGNESNDFFSVTLGGGSKYYITPWLGLRGDLRCHLMFTNSTVAASSGPSGGSVSFAGEVFAQGEVAGVVFLAFGGPRETSDRERPLEDFRHRETVPFE
ncbi:MAG: hypothetical protein IPN90_09880 [Elusimicrobia bacterium]|nr:hypothetical protein [Elusimicrobiota bacterium]